MSSCNPASTLIEKIRSSIEDPSLRRKHFADDNDRWSKFCVALDTLEDSDLAISDFLAAGLGERDGERYLRLYGVLQAIFIQQDAISALCEIVMEESLSEQPEDSAWRAIRNIRNHSAGHPVEVTRNGATRRTFVTRMGLEFGQLSLITDVDDGTSVYWGGRLEEIVTAYLAQAAQFLEKILIKIPAKWPDLET
jgi:hypothetical protein